jgi:Gpi18-like mannosyltransferase
MILRHPLDPSRRNVLAELALSLDTPAGLAAMFGLGLALRLAIAPYVGFHSDLEVFQSWVGRLAAVGTHHFYAPGFYADYPPGYLYVLWVIAKISATAGYVLLKLPAILADLALAWVAGVYASRIASKSFLQRVPIRALVAAAVLFNPAVFGLSAVWGQVDSVTTLFVLLSLLFLFTGPKSVGREIVAFLFLAIALATKVQAGFVLPVMLYALYRRHLHRRHGQELFDGALTVGLVGVPSIALWAVSGLPFGLGPVALVRFYRQWASLYKVTSANAFNLWGALGQYRNDVTGTDVLKIAGVPALYVGTALFLAAVVVVIWRVHRALDRGADEARVLTVGAAVVSLGAFVLLTRMHERYMFPALVILAPLLVARPIRRWYAVLSGLFVLNVWYAYAYFNTADHVQALTAGPVFGWLFGGYAALTWQKTLLSLAVARAAAMASLRAFQWAEAPEKVAVPAVRPTDRAPGSPDVTRRTRGVAIAGRIQSLLGTALAATIAPLGGSERTAMPESAQAPAAQQPGVVLPPGLRSGLDALERAVTESSVAARRWAFGLAGLASVFGLIVLRGETRAAANLNDSTLHLQMVRWATGQIHQGHVPLDGWFPYFTLGSSVFHHYQSLAEIVTAYLANVIHAGDQTTYDWFLYLLLATWPIAVYLGARLLEWEPWPSAGAAALSPLIVSAPGYGLEHGSYTWQGYGVYSQLWAMWLLPLTVGLTWRAVAHGKRYAAAALAVALTVACHYITGYLALLTIGVWVMVLARSGFIRRVMRGLVVGLGALLIATWVIVPTVADTTWTAHSEYYVGSFYSDGYGSRKILGWLFTGGLFDHGRFPIFTVLFFLGLIVCVAKARRDARSRALLGVLILSFILTSGRRTFGPLVNHLPGFTDIQMHRFIMGIDLAAIFIAGIGLAWLVRSLYLFFRWIAIGRPTLGRYAIAGAVSLGLAVAVLEPAWADRARYDNRGGNLVSSQQQYDAAEGRAVDRLLAIVAKRHDGRVYAGARSNWGENYKVGSVQLFAWLPDHGIDSIGYTFRTVNSLSTDPEVAFDETNPAQYQMYNIRYLLLPSGHPPPVPAKLIGRDGGNNLYRVKTTGYFQVVDRSAAISEDRTDIEQNTRAWRNTDLASRSIYPGIAYAGGPAPPPTFSGAAPPPGTPGVVLKQSNVLANGIFDATVRANRHSVVLLKATYDRRWAATVDGVPVKPVMMAPSLVGVEVGPGVHVVRFEYTSYPHYPWFFAVGLLTLLALVLFPRRERISRHVARLRRAAA